MKKSIKLLLLVILIVSTVFSGCSKSKKAQVTDNGVKAEKVNIRIAYFGSPRVNEMMQKIIKNFEEKNENIVVEAVHSNWKGHHDKIKAELAAGEGPTVFMMDGPFVEGYARRDALVNLTEKVKKDIDTSKFYGIEAVRNAEGNIFAIPQGIQVDVLYYNKDMFDEAGISYPTKDWTLNDLKEAASKLTDKEKGQFGFAIPNHIRYGYYPIVRSYGADLLDKSRENSIIAKEPKLKDAMKWIKEAWDQGWVPNVDDMAGELGNKYATYFPRKKVAMFYDSFVGTVRANESGVNYDVQLQPTAPDGERYAAFIANTWVMNNNATKKEQEAGWEFIKYYLSDEASEIYAENGDALPVNKLKCQEKIKATKQPENIGIFLDVLEYAKPLGENAVWREWKDAFEQVLDYYLIDRITLDEFIEKADKDVQKILDDFYRK